MSDNHHPRRPFSRRDDERLVMFLQEHRPSAPPSPLDSEERLLLLLDRQPASEEATDSIPSGIPDLPARLRWRLWTIPSAIAIGSLLAWGSYRVRAPLPELVTEQQSIGSTAIAEADAIELEPALESETALAPRTLEELVPAVELEEFFAGSWDDLAPTPTATLRTYEAEWLLPGAEPATAGTSALSPQAEPAIAYP
ncbi:MAG: hypothetical protein AAFY11_03345 [Cyanobacteria bacterium J06641_5]